MSMHPYKGLPSESFWKSGVSEKLWPEINFKISTKFKMTQVDKIATGGSCFAQHIAKHLSSLGLSHYITEMPPKFLGQDRASELNYGVFSARYGNIYTVRQLRDLIEFAFGWREPIILASQTAGGWVDLLRPGVQAEPYQSLADLECDRIFHLDCVRKMWLEADVFIFTAGLTETWYDVNSGIMFPVCPGTKAGEYDPDAHKFKNFKTSEVLEDLNWCIQFIGTQNKNLKWIFTVSPVALSATATNQHVLLATTNAKSILRAAIDEICENYSTCEYFPSYEITLSAANFGQFLDSDLRSISPRGVNLVLRKFQSAFAFNSDASIVLGKAARSDVEERIRTAVKAECDEAFNDPRFGRGSS